MASSKKSLNENAVVLLSGGMDSAACLDFLSSNSYNVSCLFVNYGQLALSKERTSAKKISKYYDAVFQEIRISRITKPDTGFIQGRNLLLFSVALMVVNFRRGIVSSGIHKGTTYSDCTPLFLKTVQDIYDIYTEGRIRPFSPFISWNKMDIWNYCQAKGVPVNLTYSCERGTSKPCGKCLSCLDTKQLYAGKVK